MSNHTPGPWKHIEGTASIMAHKTVANDSEGYDYDVAQVERIDGAYSAKNDPESQANARLIAAAPELLEALNKLVTALEQSRRVVHIGGAHDKYEIAYHIGADNPVRRARAAIVNAEGGDSE